METMFGIVVIFLIAAVLLWSVVQVLKIFPFIFGDPKIDDSEEENESKPEKEKSRRIGF